MTLPRHRAPVVLLGALVTGWVVASITQWTAAPPSADVGRGTEEAFFRRGLHARELPPRGKPLRWTRGESWADFLRLPAGPATLAVEVRGHRSPVRVLAGGTVVGTIAVGAGGGEWPLTLRGDHLAVGLAVEPFAAADGRELGTQLRRVALTPGSSRAWRPMASTVCLFCIPALLLALLALACGLRPLTALGWTALSLGIVGTLLTTGGVLRSAYAEQAVGILMLGALLSAAFAWLVGRRVPTARGLAFTGALAAAMVHLVLATSSLMFVSDAVFQAHRLEQVARGDFFPTSVTQHAPPFVFPYGVSFFALLAPLARAGFDTVGLVRYGAGAAGWVASLALFAMLARRSPRWALGATLVLQILPGTFLPYSQGNFNNVFGQAMVLLFLAWWATDARGGWALGAALFAVAGLGHLSSAIVLAATVAALLLVGRRELREAGGRRAIALGVGIVAVTAYYASFSRLVLRQLPRVLDGAGQSKGQSLWSVVQGQLDGIGSEWLGRPALLLALVGWCVLEDDRLGRTVRASGWAVLSLGAAALLSPVDARYLYAATVPVAVLGALGAQTLWRDGRPALRVLTLALVALQLGLACLALVERLLHSYR